MKKNIFYVLTLFSILAISSISFGADTTHTIDFETIGNDWVWEVSENASNPAVEIVENPDKTSPNTSDSVAKFIALDAGNDWALCFTGSDSTFVVDASNCTMKIMVYKTVTSDVGFKIENSATEAFKEIKVANTTTDQWEEITFDFTDQIGNTFDKLVIIPDFAGRDQDNIIYFDNIQVPDGHYVYVPPVVDTTASPTTTAPTPPTRDASNVMSLFSDAYTDKTVDNWDADWGNTCTVADCTIASDNFKRYDCIAFAGIDFSGNKFDASSMTYFHIDIWTPTDVLDKSFTVKLVDFGGGSAEASSCILTVTHSANGDIPALVKESWLSIDVPITTFVGDNTRTDFAQLVLTTDLGTVYVDNIYLHNGIESGQGVKEISSEIPSAFTLSQNYPNPFNPTTNIKFSLVEAGHVTLKVYNVLGQEVATLVDSYKDAGTFEANFDGVNLPSGTYFYSISAGNFNSVKKMILIK